MEVRTAGLLFCNSFPYGCTATLSVLDGDAVADFIEPPFGGLTWIPDPFTGATPSGADLVGVLPAVSLGRHQLVVTVLGSYDVQSFDADGNVAVDLVSRCWTPTDLVGGSRTVDVVVTFDADGTSFKAPCSIEVASR